MSLSDQRSAALHSIEAIIREAVANPDLVVREETNARDVNGWDSLTHVSIILAIEKAFIVKLTSAEVARLETVGALLEIVLARGKAVA